MSARFLVADDHAMFRAGLRMLLLSHYSVADVAEAGEGATAVQRAEELKPDLIILDIHLPDQQGLGVSRQIITRCPSVAELVQYAIREGIVPS